jgi:hypothetical protein
MEGLHCISCFFGFLIMGLMAARVGRFHGGNPPEVSSAGNF